MNTSNDISDLVEIYKDKFKRLKNIGYAPPQILQQIIEEYEDIIKSLLSVIKDDELTLMKIHQHNISHLFIHDDIRLPHLEVDIKGGQLFVKNIQSGQTIRMRFDNSGGIAMTAHSLLLKQYDTSDGIIVFER